MNLSYKLADGSLSSDYEVGDTFVVYRIGHSAYFHEGDVITFKNDDGTHCPWFSSVDSARSYATYWKNLIPTEETKRKYQKIFTKSDLQDGMRVTYRNGDSRIVLEEYFIHLAEKTKIRTLYTASAALIDFNEDLTHPKYKGLDIMRVEDRDGTLLFERQESAAKRAVTLELTDEQIQSLKEQGIL